MHSLVHRAHSGAPTGSHAFGSPRAYELVADIAFLGRRRAAFQALIRAAGVRRSHRVLDVGCGTGYFARLIAQTVGRDGFVLGVDPSPEMIAYASRRAVVFESVCRFEVGTVEALPLSDEDFDVVVSSLVMHHLPEHVRAVGLLVVRRVLRPGGTLLLGEAHNPSAGLGWRLLAKLHGFDRMARQVPSLEALVSDGGFTDLRAGTVPPWLRYVVAAKPARS